MEIAVGNHFERGYSEREEVSESDKNSISGRVGNLLNAGATYVNAQESDKDMYKGRLITAMVDYRTWNW